MFDFHNTGGEDEDWEGLLRRHGPAIRHVHANEADGAAPGWGASAPGSTAGGTSPGGEAAVAIESGLATFLPAFRALRDAAYRGWTSIEIFTVPADPAALLSHSLALFRALETAITPPFGPGEMPSKGDVQT
jgi:sugar phosphate isomerase/epimerase